MAGSSVFPHRLVAQALLWAADAVANEEIARRQLVDSDTVRRWRNRFVVKGDRRGRRDRRGPWTQVLAAADRRGSWS